MSQYSSAPTQFDVGALDFAPTIQTHVATEAARLEFVFLHTSRAGAGPLRGFLESWYGSALRTEYNSEPPQHRFEVGEIRWQVDWISRVVAHSGRSFVVNFAMSPEDIGPTDRPVRFGTLLRDPIARLAGEFLAFRANVAARGEADAETRRIAARIVDFADVMRRNNYLTRYFSGLDLCDPLDEDAGHRARAALERIDVVGLHEEPAVFAWKLLALDVFRGASSRAQSAFKREMSHPFEGPGERFANALDGATRA